MGLGKSLRTLILAALVAVAGWNAAPGARADDLSGCWEGRWHGCTDGLEGIVKAKITRCDATHWRCVFHGWAFKVMPYRYTAILKGTEDPETGRVTFRCTTKLPIWGCYWMRGWASGCNFKARYHTDDHVGYFVMKRECCR
jgi:hypothetical protein